VSETAGVEPQLPNATARREHIPLGILHMLGATVMFAVSSALSKWQVAEYPIGEVLFVRTLTSLIVCTLLILPVAGIAVLRTKRPRDHLMRGVAQATSQTFIVIAFSLMPLAGAIAINFSSPLFATLASALLLREAVGPARWSALIVGFVGVVIVTAPGADTFQIGALFAVANAVIYGSVAAAVRGMTATESTETLTMYQMIVLTAVFAAFLPFGFVMPTPGDAAMLMANGAANALGQYWWTRALHLAPASAVTPFYYFSLVWAILLGFAVWGDVPTLGLLLGSAIVVASGLFLLWHESRR
jgi:drug/metabolite transporter (DMT)-like permease